MGSSSGLITIVVMTLFSLKIARKSFCATNLNENLTVAIWQAYFSQFALNYGCDSVSSSVLVQIKSIATYLVAQLLNQPTKSASSVFTQDFCRST